MSFFQRPLTTKELIETRRKWWLNMMARRERERGGIITRDEARDLMAMPAKQVTRLYIGGETVGDVFDIELPRIERRAYDTYFDRDGNEYVVPPIKQVSNLIAHVSRGDNYNGGVLRRAFERCEKVNILITLPDTSFGFKGFVVGYSVQGSTDGIECTRVEIRPSGPVKVQEEQMKVTKEQVKKNRFYVGSPDALRRGWGHESLQAATDHAADMIDKGQHGEEQFIVKIVRVVRKKKTPVTVEDVK